MDPDTPVTPSNGMPSSSQEAVVGQNVSSARAQGNGDNRNNKNGNNYRGNNNRGGNNRGRSNNRGRGGLRGGKPYSGNNRGNRNWNNNNGRRGYSNGYNNNYNNNRPMANPPNPQGKPMYPQRPYFPQDPQAYQNAMRPLMNNGKPDPNTGNYAVPMYHAYGQPVPVQMMYNQQQFYPQQQQQQQPYGFQPQPMYQVQYAYPQMNDLPTEFPVVKPINEEEEKTVKPVEDDAQKEDGQQTSGQDEDAKDPSQLEAPQWFSIDVECVATGEQHNKRAVAHVSLVDQSEKVLLNVYVKPAEPVFSYLTALTGLTKELVDGGVSLEECEAMVRKVLPKSALICGQNVLKDVQWLNLKEGEDYKSLCDLAGLWRCKSPKYSSYTMHSLHHKAKGLLGLAQQDPHHPVLDAIFSVRLYELFLRLQANPAMLNAARQILMNTPLDDSFAKRFPVLDGACMGNKKQCRCGAPFNF